MKLEPLRTNSPRLEMLFLDCGNISKETYANEDGKRSYLNATFYFSKMDDIFDKKIYEEKISISFIDNDQWKDILKKNNVPYVDANMGWVCALGDVGDAILSSMLQISPLEMEDVWSAFFDSEIHLQLTYTVPKNDAWIIRGTNICIPRAPAPSPVEGVSLSLRRSRDRASNA